MGDKMSMDSRIRILGSRIKGKIYWVAKGILNKPKELVDPLDLEHYIWWIKHMEEKPVYTELKYQPLISIIIPVYNVKGKYLEKCIDSILAQKYTNYEVILVDDASINEDTLRTLKKYENQEKIKVVYREKNGHISRTSNDALKEARGEFIALVDDDDELTENALYEVVKALNKNKKLDFIYSDEDKIFVKGKRHHPNFKPDWSPDTFLSMNYMSHLGVIRKSLVDEVGGFRVGYEGAQDYDLYLRVTEKTDKIYHIPKILYHWRAIPGSTAQSDGEKNYAVENGKKALEDALKRRKVKGEVRIHPMCPYYYIEYEVKNDPLVSIIIPTKDMADVLKVCLESLFEKTTYKNFEVIVVNNNSEKGETFELFDEFKRKYDNFSVMDANYEFNYSKINNEAVKKSKGKYIVLLNNDTEIITPNWLEMMLGYASQRHIGAVGVQLWYPDDKVQHAGVVMGLGVASHVFLNHNGDSLIWGGRLSVPYNYSAVTAACLMVAKSKWKEVGGLEEKLKVAFNDVDLNLKLLERGYYNICIPMVKLYHYESKSRGKDDTPEKKARFDGEIEFMEKKWKKYIDNDPFYNPNFSKRADYKLETRPEYDGRLKKRIEKK